MGSPGGGLDAEALERCSHRRPAFPAGVYNTKRPGSPECFGDPGLIHVSRVRIQLRGVSADNAFSRSGPSEPTNGHAGVANNNAPNANSACVGSGCQGGQGHGFGSIAAGLPASKMRDNRCYRAAFALRNRPLHHPSGNPHDHHRQRPADRPPPADGGLDHPFLRNFNHRTFHDPDEWFDVPSGRSCPMPSPTRSGRCSDQGVERGRQVR